MKIISIVLCLIIFQTAIAQQTLIRINALDYERNQTIVEVTLQKPLHASYNYKIVNQATGVSAAVQQTDSGTIIFMLPERLHAHETATYRLEKNIVSQKSAMPVKMVKSAKGILITLYEKPVLFYNTALIHPPDTLPEIYARSGFIHPLYTPAGKVLTDDFPVGHAHQHGIMMAWANTMFKKKPHDFWNQHQKTGNVQHVKEESINTGPVISTLKCRLQHYINSVGEVLNEIWTLTIYPVKGYFLFDIRSEQTNTTTDTLFLNKYLYGGMAFRGSNEWNNADSFHFKNSWRITTDSKSGILDADGSRAAYVSASGLINGTETGVTVFGFPENDNYPQPIRVHPVMPYWCFAPAASIPFMIQPGKPYISHYRYYVHDGSPDETRIKQLNNDVVYPPEVRVYYR
jgi:hypothetical protein